MDNEFIFRRMMEYILRNDFENARSSIVSDISKIDNNPLSGMIIMSSQDSIELIKNVAGFPFMNEKIQTYYNNPQKALNDYKQSIKSSITVSIDGSMGPLVD